MIAHHPVKCWPRDVKCTDRSCRLAGKWECCGIRFCQKHFDVHCKIEPTKSPVDAGETLTKKEGN